MRFLRNGSLKTDGLVLQPLDGEEERTEMQLALPFAIHICCRVSVHSANAVFQIILLTMFIQSASLEDKWKKLCPQAQHKLTWLWLSLVQSKYSVGVLVDHYVRPGFPRVRNPWLGCACFMSKHSVCTILFILWGVKVKSSVAWNQSSYCFLCCDI